MNRFHESIDAYLQLQGVEAKEANIKQLYEAVARAAVGFLPTGWSRPRAGKKRACYFSAEFLVGRLIFNNLLNMGLMEDLQSYLRDHDLDLSAFEEIEDAALGNGGLGRLAACFLDSAATHDIPLDGYGIRYKYGLFRQYFERGFQKETVDDWTQYGDPWSIRREEDAVIVRFRGQAVRAVPYDMPVIGYGRTSVNFLRLWQAEAIRPFDFNLFNEQKYDEAVAMRNRAEEISAVLYPNDDSRAGKILRLKQQYFFSSASLQNIVTRHVAAHGPHFSTFGDEWAIQLNDTHPVVSIPELLRILMAGFNMGFDEAMAIVRKTFAYTNHTIMAEALEKWDVGIFLDVLPDIYPYVVMLQNHLQQDLHNRGINGADQIPYYIIDDGQIHMARIAIFATHSTNGVAEIHSNLLKTTVLKEWHALYPERFNNKTNGITQRRWLKLCNPELSDFITARIGDGWITDLAQLEKLRPYADDPRAQAEFLAIKRAKKTQLAAYVKKVDTHELNADMLFDIQIKRLHEYKRQLLNALSTLDLYYGIKEGRIQDFYPTAYIFGAKAAPGYYRAKGIIKLLNEISWMINTDDEVNQLLQVVFLQNYNVSYAERLIPAADISEQISTAGTEASGTGNMKLMLNGAVTLGTMDGANIEIVEQAGEENNYIFGATVADIEAVADSYDPKALYQKNPRIRRVLDTLVDGTLKDGKTGMFQELYDSILEGADWHKPDQYYLLLDFEAYCDAKVRANRDFKDQAAFARKCLLNIAGAGHFSSDRSVREYARDIWGL